MTGGNDKLKTTGFQMAMAQQIISYSPERLPSNESRVKPTSAGPDGAQLNINTYGQKVESQLNICQQSSLNSASASGKIQRPIQQDYTIGSRSSVKIVGTRP